MHVPLQSKDDSQHVQSQTHQSQQFQPGWAVFPKASDEHALMACFERRWDNGNLDTQTYHIYERSTSSPQKYMYVRMYVCTYVCMYACMYVCTYVRMYVCTYMYVCMYVCTYVCMYVRMYVCTYVHMYVYVRICTYMYVYVRICTYMYVYVRLCMYM